MSRSAYRAITVTSLLLVFTSILPAQDGPPAHPPRPKLVGPAKWEPSAQEVSVAYWTLEPGWSTTLEMRNNVTHHELTVTPVLRASTGKETKLSPVTIAPQHVVSLDLRNAAANSTTLGPFGSLAFRFEGLNASNLFAAAIVRREGEPIDFHFDGEYPGSNYTSGGVEGMWWLPAATSIDYLILSNPLKKTVTGTLALSSAFASHRPIAVSLGPGETKRIDLGELLGPSSIGSVGGLSLSLRGKELISATQIVFDEVTGLAAMMKMFDREPDDQPKSHLLRAPMMALSQPDQGLGFPNGTQLLPRIFLRNAGSAPTQVSATVDWRNQSSGTFALPSLTLSPGEVTTISLGDYQKAGQIPPDGTWGTLKLAYAGRRADLVAVAVSYDKDHRYGLQTPFSEELSRLWVGGMWHVDATHNTFITTGNGGSEATTAEVTLFYNGGTSRYRTEKMLSPGQQLWLDIEHLVHDQIPDSDGHTLPPDTMTGSYELRDLDHATVGQLYEGKLVMDKTYGHAAYGCGSCCGYDTVVFDPTTFGGPPGIDNPEFIHANDTCSGTVDDVTGSAYGWASNNTPVATLPNSTLHTIATGNATGSSLVQLPRANPPRCGNTVFGPQQSVTVKPSITSLTPPRGLIGNSINVTVSGTGFGGSGLSMYAGSGITVTINSSSSTQIRATFAVSSTASGGNSGVTVTAGGQTSSPVNFYVQIPKTMIRDASYGTSGLGSLVTITNGNVVDIYGNIIASNECGVYRNIGYLLVDQESPAQTIQGNYTLVEQFSNYTTTVSGLTVPPTQDNPIVYAQTRLGDTQFFGARAPSCPSGNEHEGFDQSLTVQTDASHSYGLSMVNHIDRGYYSGAATVNVTINTP